MNQRLVKSLMLALILVGAGLLTPRQAAAHLESGTARSAPILEDIPELPMADGSSDTPEIEVSMLDGKKVKLSSLRGKVCILDIFASWCPHCQDHAPQIVKVYNQFKAQGLEIISLASDPKEKIDDVKKFVKDYNVNYPVGFLSNEVLAYYADPRNHSVPQVVLFGKNGKMSKRWIGWSEERTKELTELLGKELSAAAPAAEAKK